MAIYGRPLGVSIGVLMYFLDLTRVEEFFCVFILHINNLIRCFVYCVFIRKSSYVRYITRTLVEWAEDVINVI